MYCLIVLALVELVSANVYQNAQCPLVKPVQDFNLEAFGNGVWYELAKYPNDVQKGRQCGISEYKLQGDKILLKSYYVTSGKLVTIEGGAQLATPTTSEGKLLYMLPIDEGGASQEFTGWVLDTDYENYAIIYHCKYHATQKIRQDFVWILSRATTLDPKTKARVDKFIRESTLLDSSKFEYADFSEATCRNQY